LKESISTQIIPFLKNNDCQKFPIALLGALREAPLQKCPYYLLHTIKEMVLYSHFRPNANNSIMEKQTVSPELVEGLLSSYDAGFTVLTKTLHSIDPLRTNPFFKNHKKPETMPL
jgi:hypothetical protein